jgi:heme ABC exporter ATP-binding subunit CcmA
MEPVIHLREAVALLGRFPALAGATLDVERGEVVLVRGPNGAGKSTLLRVCAGLVAVTAGEATVLGHDLRSDRRSVRRSVGLLGHANHLYGDLTVEENVRFWGRTAGARAAEIDAAIATLGLSGRLARTTVARLSAGQRRRTAVASLVVRRPELWLLDEPHAGLDSEGRELLDDLVRRAVAAGATVILASHELDRTEALADRAIHLVGGRVDDRNEAEPQAPPADQVAEPAGPVPDPPVEAAEPPVPSVGVPC